MRPPAVAGARPARPISRPGPADRCGAPSTAVTCDGRHGVRPPTGRRAAVALADCGDIVVTTKGRPSSRASSRSVPKSRAGATRTASAARRGPAHTTRRAPNGKVESPAEGILRTHAADLWAIALATVGILLGLALYGGSAGWLGSGVDNVLGTVVGWTRFVLPPVCVAAGAVIIVGRHRPEPLRTGIGAALGLLAVSGLAELAGGSPRPVAPAADLRAAGGWIGAVIGRPLQLGLGTAGAVVLLVAVVVVGVVLSTGVSLSTLGRGLATAVTVSGRTAGRWWAGARIDRPLGPLEAEAVAETTVPPVAPPIVTDEPPDPLPEPADLDDTGGEAAVADVPDVAEEPSAGTRARAHRPEPTPTPAVGEWQLPPMTLLKRSKEQRHDERQLDPAGEALVAALAAHGVETRLVGRTVGPTVTRFELELGPGVKVARVTSLSKDIAYAMASPDVRILAPIPGKSAIGVEVPNRQRQLVTLGDVLASDEARQATHPLEVALGRDIAGRAVMVNLADMPHVLISGATGAGQVVVHQLADHLDPDAGHARAGPADPGRPQAGRARPVQRAAPPAHPGRGRPEEGGQRPVVGGHGDGAPLRPAGRGRHARHHRVQRGRRPRASSGPRRAARRVSSTSGGRADAPTRPRTGRPTTASDGRRSERPTGSRGGRLDRAGRERRGVGRRRSADRPNACPSSWSWSTSSTTS